MADRMRLVTLTRGGRPLPSLDLERADGTLTKARGSTKLPNLAPKLGFPQAVRARSFSLANSRTDDPSSIGATWAARGSTYEECARNIERLLAAVDSGGGDRYIEWRGNGLQESGLFKLLGPGSYSPVYDANRFFQNRSMDFEISWPCEPEARGLQWDVDEQWESAPDEPDGRVNLTPNPGFEISAANWNNRAQNTVSPGRVLVPVARAGSNSQWAYQMTRNTDAGGVTTAYITQAVPNTRLSSVVTASSPRALLLATWIYTPVGQASRVANIRFGVNDEGGTELATATGANLPSVNTVAGTWQRVTALFPSLPVGAVEYTCRLQVVGNEGESWYWDDVLIEEVPVGSVTITTLPDYIDGDMPTYRWRGTPGNSASVETTDSVLSEWTFIESANLAYSRQGYLGFTSLGVDRVRMLHTGRNAGPRKNDCADVTFEWPGTGFAQLGIVLAGQADGSGIVGGINSTGILNIWTMGPNSSLNGVVTGTDLSATLVAGRRYTMRFRHEGTSWLLSMLDDTGAGIAAESGNTYNVTAITGFRTDGEAGLYINGVVANGLSTLRINGFARRPFTWWTTTDTPETFPLDNLPGVKGGPPHRIDLSLLPLSGSGQKFGLVAWAAKRGADNWIWNGDFEKDILGWAASGAGQDGGVSVGGTTGATLSRVTGAARFGSACLQVVTPGTVTTEAASFKTFRRVRKGVPITAVFWYRQIAGALTSPRVFLGASATDRFDTVATLPVPSATAWTQGVVTWIPTADEEWATLSLTPNGTIAGTYQYDGIAMFEGDISQLPQGEQGAGKGALRPFGKIAVVGNDYRTNRVGTWALTGTSPNQRYAVTPGGAGSFTLEFLLDPLLLDPPEGGEDVVLDLYAHGVLASTIVDPRLTASVALTNVNAGVQYAQPHGAPGKGLVRPTSGSPERTWSLGQVTLDRASDLTGRVSLRVTFSCASGSTGAFELEYLMLAPTHGVAQTATGKQNDATYPDFVPATAGFVEAPQRMVRSDLSMQTVGAGSGSGTVDGSLGGEPLELPAGDDAIVTAMMLNGVPDDPTSGSFADIDNPSGPGLITHVGVRPRHRLLVPAR